jgi:phosphoglycerate kinase
VVGGGETGAAVTQMGIADRISYISTGGGACLALLEGKTLLALDALRV